MARGQGGKVDREGPTDEESPVKRGDTSSASANADDREIEESRCLKIFLVGLVGHVTQEVLAPSKGSRDTTQAETVNTVRRT